MIFRSSVVVDKNTADAVEKAVMYEPTCEEEMFRGCICVSIPFPNGFCIDVAACECSYYDPNEVNTAWIDGVLFDPMGYEIETMFGDGMGFFDDWEFTYDGDTYIGSMIVAKE